MRLATAGRKEARASAGTATTRARVSVLFTIPNLITAGSRMEIYHLAKRLDPLVFRPAVAVLKRGGTLEAEFENIGVPVMQLPFTVKPRPLSTLPARCWAAARVCRRAGFDLWHSFHYSDDYTEPLIARLAGARAWIYLKKNMSWRGNAWKIRSLAAAHIVARNTTMLSRFFGKPWFRRKVMCIPAGVDPELFRPGVPARLELRQRLGIGADEFLVGCVANLEQVKAQDNLILAAAGRREVHLALAGAPYDPGFTAHLHSMAAELGLERRVHFLGRIDDVPALCGELDAFVLPTRGSGRGEGFGVALTEAMSCGLPCISTEIDGPRDMIEHGRSGLLVPPDDVLALSSALGRLLDSAALRRRLGAEARRRVLDFFTIDREAAETEKLYRRLLRV